MAKRITNKVRSIAFDPRVVAENTMRNAGYEPEKLYSDLLAFNASGDRAVAVYEDENSSGYFFIVCMKKRGCQVLQYEDVCIECLENEDGVTAMSYADGWIG